MIRLSPECYFFLLTKNKCKQMVKVSTFVPLWKKVRRGPVIINMFARNQGSMHLNFLSCIQNVNERKLFYFNIIL